MKRCERLLATLNGKTVDRPAVSFYELNGLDENPADSDPFNIYCDPSWHPLIELTREKTDRIVMREIPLTGSNKTGKEENQQMVGVPRNPLDSICRIETFYDDKGSRFIRRIIKTHARELSELTRRDRDVNTIWTVEPLLKNLDDLRALLDMPLPPYQGQPEIDAFLETERQIADTGIVLIDTPDPLCLAAGLFEMQTFTIIALTEQALFEKLLEYYASFLHVKTRAVTQKLPGRLWRIYGPEYAARPYLPPSLFQRYVGYDRAMVEAIKQSNGWARVHIHGNIRANLDDIVEMGFAAIDPIEPPPQGDVELRYVREKYGRDLVLFGNLEIADIETLPVEKFEKKVFQALQEGTAGEGKGFVLMPSASPYGRRVSLQSLKNYQRIIEIVDSY